jgi:DHA1 family 2-module integral membrane pump EmrD-like MFS transporter
MNIPKWATTAYILVLVSLGYFTTDIYLPSLPALSAYFHASENEVQMTLFSYMLSFALGPLIWGPLSDHIGRKKVVMIGIVIGIFATIGCLLTKEIAGLIAFRCIQGIGTGAVLISSRTMISDLFTGKELTQQVSYVTMFMPLVLTIAPTIGGVLQEAFHWRAVFIFLICYMFFVLVWVATRPETMKRPSHHKLSEVFSNYRFHLRNVPFLYQILFVFPTIGMYAYFTTSPFLFQEIIGLSPIEYGSLALYIGGIIIAMSFINTRLIHRVSLETIIFLGGTLMVIAGMLLLFFHFIGILTPWSLLIPVMIYFTCMPFCIANSVSKALRQVKTHFGSATALLTTLQFLAGALGTFIFSIIQDNSALPLAICFIAMGAFSLAHQWLGISILAREKTSK